MNVLRYSIFHAIQSISYVIHVKKRTSKDQVHVMFGQEFIHESLLN